MAWYHWLFGRECPFCGAPVDPEDTICEECSDLLKRTDLRFPDGSASLFRYDGRIKTAVHRFKYGGCAEFGRYCGAELAKRFPEQDRKTVVTCVPRASDGLPRAYNQSEVLARAFAKQAKLPFRGDLIRKKDGILPQPECRRIEQRKKNVAHAFLRGDGGEEIKGKHVILVDDVITTGATTRACARVLSECGAARVTVYSAARTDPGRQWKLRMKEGTGETYPVIPFRFTPADTRQQEKIKRILRKWEKEQFGR